MIWERSTEYLELRRMSENVGQKQSPGSRNDVEQYKNTMGTIGGAGSNDLHTRSRAFPVSGRPHQACFLPFPRALPTLRKYYFIQICVCTHCRPMLTGLRVVPG